MLALLGAAGSNTAAEQNGRPLGCSAGEASQTLLLLMFNTALVCMTFQTTLYELLLLPRCKFAVTGSHAVGIPV